MTDAERKLRQRLRYLPAEGTHFRRQATIGPYFADFACHASRVVIELDGGQHGDGPQSKRDAERDAYVMRRGYRVLRFWNNDVLGNVEGVFEMIVETLGSNRTPPTPDPSPPLPRVKPGVVGGGERQRRV